jgi:thiol-disulfide isomerase/thioredoxin
VATAHARRIALVLALASVTCEGKTGDVGKPGRASDAALIDQAPPLVGKTIDGEAFSLAELGGQVVLVNAWATWCAPCREELPELQRLHVAHGPRGFTVVGVSVDRRAALRAVKTMANDFGLTYPVVFDPDSEAIGPWSVRGYPTSFLVDRQGKVRWRRDGIVRPDDAELGAAIEAALAVTP